VRQPKTDVITTEPQDTSSSEEDCYCIVPGDGDLIMTASAMSGDCIQRIAAPRRLLPSRSGRIRWQWRIQKFRKGGYGRRRRRKAMHQLRRIIAN